MHVIKKPLLVAVAVLFVISLGGCNTIRGVGKDIKKGGEAIEKAAQ
jgi:entericidin B